MKVGVRRATLKDIPVLSSMWMKLTMEEHPDADPDVSIMGKAMCGMMASDNYHIYIAEVEDEPVGFNSGLICTDPVSRLRYVEGQFFYVNPEYRGKGPGKELHRNSLEVCRDQGAAFIRRRITRDHLQMMLDKGHILREFILDELIEENENER